MDAWAHHALRVPAKTGIDPLRNGIQDLVRDAPSHAGAIHAALATAGRWFHERAGDRDALEAGARGLALTFARTTAAALLARHAAKAGPAGHAAHGALALFLDHGLSRLSAASSLGVEGLFGTDLYDRDHSP